MGMGCLLVGTSQSIPASAADVSAALSPQQLLTGRTDLLPDETHICSRPCVPMRRITAMCVWKHTELSLQVASRSRIGEDLAWWWIRTVQCSKYRNGLGSVESSRTAPAHTGQDIAHACPVTAPIPKSFGISPILF